MPENQFSYPGHDYWENGPYEEFWRAIIEIPEKKEFFKRALDTRESHGENLKEKIINFWHLIPRPFVYLLLREEEPANVVSYTMDPVERFYRQSLR